MFDFRKCFQQLTENDPFDWQEKLFQKFINGEFPDACDIPTGMGKTNVMTIWLIALACQLKNKNRQIPLRLVYVVDRRVIVDQATDEAEKLLEKIKQAQADELHPLHDLAKIFQEASMKGKESLIALSTLRGQKADNREWCLDPSRPAIIIGTVDMIGSRLLFSGYGKVGINHLSLQAGLLGQDTFIVIDEAHLSPVFVDTLNDIKEAIQRTKSLRPFQVMTLSATLKGKGETLQIDENAEFQNKQAELRLNAKKQIEWLSFDQRAKVENEKKNATHKEINEVFAECLVNRAIQYEEPSETEPAKSIVIYVQTVDLVNLITEKLADELEKKTSIGEEIDKKAKEEIRKAIDDRILKMTGEMRGAERDDLAKSEKFKMFLPDRDRTTPRQTHYLIATSCAEVGINLDADHALCDLSTLDSMIQRIGRVNRLGLTDSIIIVVLDEHGINAVISDLQEEQELQKMLSKFSGEIEALESDLEKSKSDKTAKREISKQITAKKKERKDLEKKGATYQSKEIERVDTKVFFTWQALKSREDESHKINASPLALRGLLAGNQAALPDEPVRPPFDEARIDDWAMTSLKQKEYPRPLVQYWLRGVIDDEKATTTFVWRTDLNHFENVENLTNEELAELATTIPIQPKERANLATFRAEALLKLLAAKFPEKLIVITDPTGESKAYSLQQIKDEKKLFALIAFSTVILPCEIGGLDADGNPLDKLPKEIKSVGEVVGNEWSSYLITRFSDSFSIQALNEPDDDKKEESPFKSWQAAVRSIKDKGFCKNTEAIQKAFAADSADKSDFENKNEGEKAKSYIAYFLDRSQKDDFTDEDADDSASLNLPPRSIKEHDEDVEKYARFLAEKIGLPSDVIDLLAAAGARHDLGKAREWWQKAIGNFSTELYAKSNNNSFDHTFNQGYRHEFGSLIESLDDPSLTAHPDRDLILHLIAAHHGYARPYFPERAFDRNQPKPLNQQIAHETLLRFNRLQQQYGWWQLAYLEAVLKAADALASRDFSKGNLGGEL